MKALLAFLLFFACFALWVWFGTTLLMANLGFYHWLINGTMKGPSCWTTLIALAIFLLGGWIWFSAEGMEAPETA